MREISIYKNKKYLKIHYYNWDTVYDEYISVNSERLSTKGFVTDRKDVLRYRVREESRYYNYLIFFENDFMRDYYINNFYNRRFN